MAYIRYLLIITTILLIAFSFPNPSTAFQSSTDGGIRIITLSSSGSDIANSVAYSPDGNWLAVGVSSGIFIFDSQTLIEKRFISTGVWVRCVTFSPDGSTVAAGLFDGTARFWRLADGQEIRQFTGHDGWVRSVAFTSDGVLFATAADDDAVRIWDAASGALKLSIPNLPGVRVLALSPDGQTLAAGLQDTSIQLRTVTDGNLLKTLTGHKDWVRSLAFSPDSKTLASGAFDATAILWDVASGAPKFSLTDHQSSVLSVSFSPDGNTLASASVDSTVKLWNVDDGNLLRTLVGHADFVYSVVFSPDGKTIASGSSDNSVRLWDLGDPTAGASPQTDTPSDCRACHHPIGTHAPPRVIQVNCEACHANGIGMNWCPFFARSTKFISDVSYFPPMEPIGVPISSENIAVEIVSPSNGETLYSTAYSLSPAFVYGNVFYRGDQSTIKVQMEIWSGGQLTGELFAQPDQEGNFTFNIAVNPDGAPVVAGAKAADPDCASCHEDFNSQAYFPDGPVHIVITAISPDGERASDERWLTVDTSGKATLDVRVIDQEGGASIPGLSVRAATVLYEWRDRFENQVTDADGRATLSLEALSQTITRYEIKVPPTSLNGYLYEGVDPVILELLPAAESHEPVTIYVNVRTGQITGTLTGVQQASPLEIWAVHLPDGAYHKTSAANGTFTFADLPSGEYQLLVDPAAHRLGVHAEPIQVDLTQQAQASISIELKETSTASISGRVYDAAGTPLPFGWITAASTRTSQLDPVTGNYQLPRLDPAKVTVIADVPGYYSQAQVTDLSAAQEIRLDFSLVRRPDTTLLPWGDGNLILPSVTVYEASQGTINLQNGWIWGENGTDAELNLQVAGNQITLQSGSFAVKYTPLQGGWLYLPEGEALLRTADSLEVRMSGGEMVALSEHGTPLPVPFNETVVASFQQNEESPLISKWEPTLEAQARDRLAQIGISIAQVITFVTYMLVLIVIAGLLIGGIYSTWKYFRNLLH